MGGMKPKLFIWLLPLLLYAGGARSQEDGRAHFRIRYVINIPVIDSTFVDNGDRISDMREFLQTSARDPMLRFTGVRFKGTASPDGGYEFNRWLCENRLRTFKELVNSYIDLPDSLIHANTSDIPWDEFRSEVAASELPYRDEILAVIDEGQTIVPWFNGRHIDARLLKLKRMHRGKVWESLKRPILHDLRYGDAVFEYYRMRPPITPPRPSFGIRAVEAPALPVEPSEQWMPHIYLKTNFLGLGMLMANLACELDMAPHWSFALPIYYSGIDYFKSTVKFRNFTVQPEFRYWFTLRNDGSYYFNDGLFAGVHLGVSYYNFAFDGAYRYQDHCGRTPAIGGGVSLGYRTSVSRNKRWKMEFTVGAGIYPLDYDLFDNTPDVRDGQLTGREQMTYIGLDQAAVTLAYTFDWKRRVRDYRKGGRR